jgi:hypothetical protein
MTNYVKAIIYTSAAVWAVILLAGGQQLSSAQLRPLSTATSVVVLLSIAFELWLWKLRFLHGWLVKRPVIDGTWRAEIQSNWKNEAGESIPPIEGYVVIRQSLINMSLRLMTKESCQGRSKSRPLGRSKRLPAERTISRDLRGSVRRGGEFSVRWARSVCGGCA